jgi:hypothetical protein
MVTILMNDYPYLKFLLIGALGGFQDMTWGHMFGHLCVLHLD